MYTFQENLDAAMIEENVCQSTRFSTMKHCKITLIGNLGNFEEKKKIIL